MYYLGWGPTWGIGYLNSLDFYHKANAPITSLHNGKICQYGSTEEIVMEGKLKAKGW